MASRGANWSQEELSALIDGFVAHHAEINGKHDTNLSEKSKDVIYANILTDINSVSQTRRTHADMLKKWSDYKSRTKKKEIQRMKAANQTGGGAPSTKLSILEEKVLNVIPKCSIEGIGGTDTFKLRMQATQLLEHPNHEQPEYMDTSFDQGSSVSNSATQFTASTAAMYEPVDSECYDNNNNKENMRAGDNLKTLKGQRKGIGKQVCNCKDRLLEIQEQLLVESRIRNSILEEIKDNMLANTTFSTIMQQL